MNLVMVYFSCMITVVVIVLIFTINPAACLYVKRDLESLRLVHVIYRHGDRSPAGTFPNDPHKKEIWPQGWSQLTSLGMQQHYELGQQLRQRYSGFLNPTYNRDEIYVRSADMDRTMQSAIANLVGLYPADGNQPWPGHLPRGQPVPIHTVPHDEDRLLEIKIDNCEEYTQLMKRVDQPVIEELNKNHKELFDYLKNATGLKKVNFQSIEKIFQPLFCEFSHGHPKPDWLNESMWDTIKLLTVKHQELYVNSPEKTKFTAGLLIGDIMKRMKDKATSLSIRDQDASLNSIRSLKMQMYSTHQEAVATMMGAFGILNGITVPYAGCLIIELHEKDNEFRVKVFLRNETAASSVPPYRMTIRNCQRTCTLQQFEEALKDVTLSGEEDWKRLCKVPAEKCTRTVNNRSENNDRKQTTTASDTNIRATGTSESNTEKSLTASAEIKDDNSPEAGDRDSERPAQQSISNSIPRHSFVV